MTSKSRNLTLLEYLEQLIKECLQADLRRKIYPRPKDKEYWTRVYVGKRNTIRDITVRNSLPSIFDSDAMRERYYAQYFPVGQIPSLLETDDDLHNYFTDGADVFVYEGDQREIANFATISSVEWKTKTVVLEMRDTNDVRIMPMEKIRRLF